MSLLQSALAAAALGVVVDAQQSTSEAAPEFFVELASPEVEIPLDHATGYAGISVEIDGQGPFEFHFDTYASIHATIDERLAAELDLPKVGTALNSDGIRVIPRDLVWIDRIEVGGLTLRNVTALVDDYAHIPTKNGSLQGLIGFPALRDYLVTFDYPEHRLLVGQGVLTADAPNTIPIALKTGCPDITLDLGGESVTFGIDTGSTTTLFLDRSYADRLEIDELVPAGQARMMNTTLDIVRGVLPHDLALAGHVIPSPSALFFELPEDRGLIGYGLLRSFAVTFDGKSRLVRFQRPSLPAGVQLSDEVLDGWVGRYQQGARTYTIERVDETLFVSVDGTPRRATLALSDDELCLTTEPTHLFLRRNEDGRIRLHVRDHPEKPPIIAERVD